MNEQNVMDVLIGGSLVSGLIGLLVAGFWQEIRMIGKEESYQAEVQREANNHGRLQARMASSSKVIRKG